MYNLASVIHLACCNMHVSFNTKENKGSGMIKTIQGRWRTVAAILVASACLLSHSAQAGTLLKEGPGTYTVTIPADGVYRITAGGGSGGGLCCALGMFPPAAGAEASGQFALSSGDQLTVVVGASAAQGGPTRSNGGGGSYVYITGSTNVLVGAGGGGGGGYDSFFGGGGLPASIANTPVPVVSGTVVGIDGQNGACCGTSTAQGAGGVSMVAFVGPPFGGSSFISSTSSPQGFVRITSPPFAIGGTITGLGLPGLVIQNNSSGNQTIASGSTSFSFASEPDGAAYDVSVLTNPTGSVCSVSNGTGSIADDDVSNIAISCVASTYTVSGTISGSAGTGGTLLNNGSSAQAIANGAFSFPAQNSGTTYSVTVGVQPSGLNQVCTVANGSGTVTGSIGNVAVTCVTSTYTVSGTVSGLSGSGLSLLNNGLDSQAISNNGPFSFTAQDDGTGYEVTVGSNPATPGQVCTVAQGSGTLAGASVSNVTVQCVNTDFSVSGTVAGLSGTGLILQNNGGDSQVISSAGPFTFTEQADGSNYSVSVSAQPSAPAQTCAVTNGAGTIATANINNVSVQCTDDPVRAFSGQSRSGSAATISFVTADPACTFSVDPQFTAAASPPDGVSFPQGVVSYTVGACTAGAQIDVTIDYGTSLPSGSTVWKSDPWTEITSASISGAIISYSITDGGPLDADGVMNGVIVDPVGAGVRAGAGASATPVPSVPLWGLAFLALILGYVGNRKIKK